MKCPSCGAENHEAAESCFTCGRTFGLSTATVTRGTVLAGRYEILSQVGKGGMGMVYQAHDRSLDEIVALKTMKPDLVRQPGLVKRFQSEIKLARKVRHPNVCAIHEYGEHDGLHFISMEFVDGIDLRRFVREGGRLKADEAFDVAIQIAQGLKAMHQAGIIHRDIKTPNIMRDGTGRVRLMDFGIAKQFGSDTTLGGQVVGTPEYMSPEQARGKKVDFRSDVYALGIVLYEIFTGKLPFRGETPIATILKQINDAPPLDSAEAAEVPASLVPVLRRALAKDPEDRYGSAGEMLEALRHAREACAATLASGAATAGGPRRRARVEGRSHAMLAAGTGAVVVALVSAAAVLWWHSAGTPPTAREAPGSERRAAEPRTATSPEPAGALASPAAPKSPAAAADATREPTLVSRAAGSAPRATPTAAAPTLPRKPAAPAALPSATANAPAPAPNPPAVAVNPPSGATSPPRVAVNPPAVAVNPPAVPVNPPAQAAARPPVQPGEPVAAGPGVAPPVLVTAVEPSYPPLAARLRREGRVVVRVLVDESGKVLDAQLVVPDKSSFGFNEAALGAARRNVFQPATRDGVPVRMWIELPPFNFRP